MESSSLNRSWKRPGVSEDTLQPGESKRRREGHVTLFPQDKVCFFPGRCPQKSLMGSLVSRSARASARVEVPDLLTS